MFRTKPETGMRLAAGGAGSEIMPLLSRSRQVIAVDLEAHGQTADIDRPLSYVAMAEGKSWRE